MDNKIRINLEKILDKYNLLDAQMQDPIILKDIKKYSEISKNKSKIEDIVIAFKTFQKAEEDLKEAILLSQDSDVEMKNLGLEEKKRLIDELETLEKNINILLLPKDKNDDKNIIMEIHGAAGGEEANIFAGDLFKMYTRYIEKQKWIIKIIELSETESGGYSNIVFSVKGKNVYSKLKFESGAHRVQRVPKTESKGRVHTSTSVVAVLPEVDEVEITINNSDLKIDTYRASGAGGQHVNTTDSAVRITHVPTGVVVTSQDGRSQHSNKALALRHLRSKLYQIKMDEQNKSNNELRQTAIGTGDRSEKIRTYNYPQNRVTDHRINLTINKLSYIMQGDIDELINSLIKNDQTLRIEKSNI